jgi:hypothetical protein
MAPITPEKELHLLKLHASRKLWKPVITTSFDNMVVKPIITRIIAVRTLELCIKASVESAFSKGLIPESLKPCYETIITDEENHDFQLVELAIHYNVETEKLPALFINKFNFFAEEYDPLVLNYVIECVVFINTLPLLQRFGDAYANSVASWILLDEARHVAFGRVYASALGLPIPTDVIRLAMDILAWVLEFETPEVQEATKRRAFLCLEKGVPTDTVQVIPQAMRFFEHKSIENYEVA